MKNLSSFITFLLLFISTLHADVKIDKSLKIDEKLKNSINQFWDAYTKADAKKMYSMEAPYFRVLYNFEKYQAYVNTLFKPNSIYIREIDTKDALITTAVLLAFDEKNVTIVDKWLMVDKNYYHKSEVFMLFQE